MAKPEKQHLSKEERRRQRVETARRRQRIRLLRRAAWGLALVAPLALWAYEQSGEQDLVEAEVVETQRWRHVSRDEPAHDHVRAIFLIEGRTRVQLDRADGRKRGDRVPVWVRRGRLTGRPRFLDFAAPGERVPEDG